MNGNFFGRSTTGPKHLAPDTGSGGALPPNGTVLGSEGGEAEFKPSVPKKPAKPKKTRRSFWQFVKDVFNGFSKTVATIIIIAIVALALVGLALWNPLHWTFPTISWGQSVPASVSTLSTPVAASAQTLADLKVLAHQFSIKGTADLDRLYQQKLIDANQYLLFSQLFENDKALASELNRVASTQDENNLVFGNAIKAVDARVTSVDARVTSVDKKVAAVGSASTPAGSGSQGSGSQGSTLIPAGSGSQGSGSVSVPAKASGVSWKDWKNPTPFALTVVPFGVNWPAGYKYPDLAYVDIPAGGKFWPNDNLQPGDYGVMYALGKYTIDQIKANPELASKLNYYDVDGGLVQVGTSREGWAIDQDGTLHSGYFIKDGEPISPETVKHPVSARYLHNVSRFLVPIDDMSRLIRLRNN